MSCPIPHLQIISHDDRWSVGGGHMQNADPSFNVLMREMDQETRVAAPYQPSGRAADTMRVAGLRATDGNKSASSAMPVRLTMRTSLMACELGKTGRAARQAGKAKTISKLG